MANEKQGTLIIIGGHEDKDGDRAILKEISARVGTGRLVVAAIASSEPEAYFSGYREAFAKVGVSDVYDLYADNDDEAELSLKATIIDEATGIFFTGGDQSRIAEQIGGTVVEQSVQNLFERGGVVAGTSAGASIMGSTMLVKGKGEETHRLGKIETASGFGLLSNVVIDQHFAERGRIGRLLGAVAENPHMMGIGIDEDTAIIVQGNGFKVAGSGAVYIVASTEKTKSNLGQADRHATLSMTGVSLDVLSAGDVFNLQHRASDIRTKN